MILFLDSETFSDVPINNGTYAYAESPEIEVMIESWAIDEGRVHVSDITAGEPGPLDIFEVDDFEWIVIHGGNGPTFDRIVGKAAGRWDIPPEKIWDTAVQARSHGLPGGLDKLCGIYKVPEALAKHKDGRSLIQLFCKPRPKNIKLRRATSRSHPVEWQRFKQYAGGDIHAMRFLYNTLPRWNYPTREHGLWVLDQKINERGFLVDVELAETAIAMMADEKRITDAQTKAATEGRLGSTTQRDKLLKELVIEHGVTLPDLTGDTIERRLEDEDLPQPVKELLRQRLLTSSTSTAKYSKILKAKSSDDRMRGSLLFCGAPRTKRWSGKIFQPQNLPRPDMDQDQIAREIDWLVEGRLDNIMEPIRLSWNALRGLIVAEKGKKLVQADLAQIEARVLPWLAGEQWKLDAFQRYDMGLGPDLYYVGAARLLGISVEEVTKAQRQSHGKVPDLACLGPHTRVLTDNGIKAITEVTLQDKLWDGEEWVTHNGLISRGVKETIKVDGLDLTTDHEMLSANGWVTAKEVASNPSIRQSVLMTGLGSLPWCRRTTDPKADLTPYGLAAIAALNRTVLSLIISAAAPLPAVYCALEKRRLRPPRSGENTQPSYLTINSVDVYAAECLPASIVATTLKTKPSLTTEVEASQFSQNGAKTEANSLPIWSRWKDGISRFWSWIASTMIKATSPATSASAPSVKTPTTADGSAIFSSALHSLKPVFDIAHAGPRNRFTVVTNSGAMIVHNCGYGGAEGAFAQFAALYRVDMSPDEVSAAIRAWREGHRAIADWDTGFWKKLDDAARLAIQHRGEWFNAGDYIRFKRHADWLIMRLPSGGYLSYAHPRIVPDPRKGRFEGRDTISFMGIDNYTKRWTRLYTYGGKLSADATQGTAREILAYNLPHVEEKYPIILQVHDEVVTEAPDDPEHNVDDLVARLTRRPPWIDDKLPLAAGGFEALRYKKED